MEENKGNSLFKKIRNGTIIATLAGGIFYGNSTEKIEKEIIPYQGHYRSGENTFLVFDTLPRNHRTEKPMLTIPDDNSRYSHKLKTQKTYIVEYAIPKWDFMFPLKIKKIEEAN